jgi:hypothetical protein
MGLLAFAGSAITKGYHISQALGGANKEVTRLLVELSAVGGRH